MQSDTVKPMLAFTVQDKTKLRFPYLVSAKLDGIRCLIINGKVLSRSLKPIRNLFIVSQLRGLDNLDGELIVGAPNTGDVLNRTTRGVMSEAGEPEFQYHVFDTLNDLNTPFAQRLAKVPVHPRIVPVQHTLVCTLNDLNQLESQMLVDGYEGLILRNAGSPYKCGRSTLTENALGKLKQFLDGELLVTAVREGMNNINVAKQDALGRTVRSKHQDGMIPNEQVGTIIGTDLKTGQHLEISPGRMTQDQRRYYWIAQDHIVDKIVKYKAFGYGAINVPRFATFQAFRDADDMS